jgi:hypothetical protein
VLEELDRHLEFSVARGGGQVAADDQRASTGLQRELRERPGVLQREVVAPLDVDVDVADEALVQKCRSVKKRMWSRTCF